LIVLDEPVEFVTESPWLVKVFIGFVIGKDVVDAARFDALLVTTL
jgi:hypothetical protein